MRHAGAMNIFVTMPIRITTDLAARIDEFWHERRLVSRAAAIRELLELGLSLKSQGGQSDELSAQQQVQQYKHEDQRKDHLHDQAERRGQGQQGDDIVNNPKNEA
jgi:metal-responsive CopG/Arc/MetJ family transcriptional regulator